MSESLKLNASCLCGAVKLTATKAKSEFDACHCSMCAKWGGGPLLTVECGSDIGIEGADNISLYSSSDWAERAFCKHCGSHLYYRLKPLDHYSLPLGLFDNRPELPFDKQIFIDEKPREYHFGNKTTELTGNETFELFAQQNAPEDG